MSCERPRRISSCSLFVGLGCMAGVLDGLCSLFGILSRIEEQSTLSCSWNPFHVPFGEPRPPIQCGPPIHFRQIASLHVVVWTADSQAPIWGHTTSHWKHKERTYTLLSKTQHSAWPRTNHFQHARWGNREEQAPSSLLWCSSFHFFFFISASQSFLVAVVISFLWW